MRKLPVLRALLVVATASFACLTGFVGCGGTEEARPSGYLDEHKTPMAHDSRFAAFQRMWYDASADWTKYRSIRIAPVHTGHLSQQDWWDKVNEASLANRALDIQGIAETIRAKFIEAFKNDPRPVLRVVDSDGPGVLVLELALVELVPTKGLLNAAGYAFAGMAFDKGSIALEARLIDSQTHAVIAKFADREEGADTLVSVKDLQWYAFADDRIEEWAEQAVQVAHADENATVDDSWDFDLKPW